MGAGRLASWRRPCHCHIYMLASAVGAGCTLGARAAYLLVERVNYWLAG